MLDTGGAAGLGEDGDHVEADLVRVEGGLGEPLGRQAAQPAHLGVADRLGG